MRIILVSWGEQEKIAKLLGCTPRTVRDALKGKTNSSLAKNIRTTAVRRGGAIIERSRFRVISSE